MKRFLSTFLTLFLTVSMWGQSWSKDLEKTAKQGDVSAQLAVANAYFNGDGVVANKNKAAQWYYKATMGNNAEAKAKLYSFYSKELEKYAKSGDAQAQYEVGMDFYEGEGVEKNTEIAAKWFLSAKTQGHEAATAKLYSYYSKSLEAAAKGGDAQAQYEVGMDYYEGNGVSKNVATAAMWFDKAKTQGHEMATNQFYSYYSKLLEGYAKQGEAKAQYYTGLAYLDGLEIAQNKSKAAKYFYASALQGDVAAKAKLCSFYSKELKKFAQIDVDAQYAIGLAYYKGDGVKKNSEVAARYLAQAMDNGNKDATELFFSFESSERSNRAIVVNFMGTLGVFPKQVGKPFCINNYKIKLKGVTTSSFEKNAIGVRIDEGSIKYGDKTVKIADSNARIYIERNEEKIEFSDQLTLKITELGKDITLEPEEDIKYYDEYDLFENKKGGRIRGLLSEKHLCDISYLGLKDYDKLKDCIKACYVSYGLSYDDTCKEGLVILNNGDTLKTADGYLHYQGGVVVYPSTRILSYTSADGRFVYNSDENYNDVNYTKIFSDNTCFEYKHERTKGAYEFGVKFPGEKRTIIVYEQFREYPDNAFNLNPFDLDFSDVIALRDNDDKSIFTNSFKYTFWKNDDVAGFTKKMISEALKKNLSVSIYDYLKTVGYVFDENGERSYLYAPNAVLLPATLKSEANNVLIAASQYEVFRKEVAKAEVEQAKKPYYEMVKKYGKTYADLFWDHKQNMRKFVTRKGLPLAMLKDIFDLEFWSSHDGVYDTYVYGSTLLYFKNGKLTHWSTY